MNDTTVVPDTPDLIRAGGRDRRPVESKATSSTGAGCSSDLEELPAGMFQIRTIPSRPAVATRPPRSATASKVHHGAGPASRRRERPDLSETVGACGGDNAVVGADSGVDDRCSVQTSARLSHRARAGRTRPPCGEHDVSAGVERNTCHGSVMVGDLPKLGSYPGSQRRTVPSSLHVSAGAVK